MEQNSLNKEAMLKVIIMEILV